MIKRSCHFFILDEMSPDSATGKRVAAFQRNIFRVCGLVVFFMGTNSKITNLVTHSLHSYEDEHRWLALVPRFPSYQLALKNESENDVWSQIVGRYPSIKYIVMNSRGRFSRYFMQKVIEVFTKQPDIEFCSLMDESLAFVNQSTQKGKHFMSSNEGKYAQLMAISYTNVHDQDHYDVGSHEGKSQYKKRRTEVGASSIHSHFANLVDNELLPIDISLSHGKLTKGGTKWEVKCCFPDIEEDTLLYLSILGCKDFSSYSDRTSGINFSTKCIFKKMKQFPVNENTNAISNDYKAFENMVAHAIFSTSRRNGVRGIPLSDFISCLIGEFQDEVWTKMEFLLSNDEPIKISDVLLEISVKNLMIPFLSPPNSGWPQSVLDMNQHGCYFGHLVRARNSDRCDIYVVDSICTPLLVCECKNWEHPVGLGKLNDIVGGIETAWPEGLVIVFCPKFAEPVQFNWTHETVSCVKINCNDRSVTSIFKSNSEVSRFVIAMEVGQ